jgi:hypothetical protein
MRRPANRQVTQQKLRRIQLVARVRIALDMLREVVARRSGDPTQARASITLPSGGCPP